MPLWNNTEVAELLPLIKQALERGEEFLLYPRGESMLPLIRPARDGVYLMAPNKLRRLDICLYRRPGGRYVLHRLIRIEKNGTLSFRGDNQSELERGISPECVIARVSAVLRDNKRENPRAFLYLFTHCSLPARLLRFGKI